MPKRLLNPMSDAQQRRTLDILKKQSTLVSLKKQRDVFYQMLRVAYFFAGVCVYLGYCK
jgi:hypothetical protein